MLSPTAVNVASTVFLPVVVVACVQVGWGAPGRTRTCDQVLRRHLLYPLSYGRWDEPWQVTVNDPYCSQPAFTAITQVAHRGFPRYWSRVVA